jgi:hypothetical protein
MSLEVLHRTFMLFGRVTRVECAEVPTLPSLRILLARVKSILSGFQFSDHNELLANENSTIQQ